MLKIVLTKSFRRDLRSIEKRGFDIGYLEGIVKLIADRQPLPPALHDHALKGNYRGKRECHLGFDWLLIYEIHEDAVILELIITGTHEELF